MSITKSFEKFHLFQKTYFVSISLVDLKMFIKVVIFKLCPCVCKLGTAEPMLIKPRLM